MSARISIFVLLVLLLSLPVAAGKKKQKFILPDYVLQAHTVAVIINPGSHMPVSNPGENRQAQDNVERALTKWGRLQPVIEPTTADLVIVVRRGRAVSPTLNGGPPNDRPIIIQPSDGGIRIGGQRGTPPPVSSDPQPQSPGPRMGTEVGPSEDLFEVYRGNVEYPLDSPPVWRYMGNDALLPPVVPAVEQFRKVIEEAEKQQKEKQKKKP
ncbi:MAG TPA: hypothetical protein VFJ47_12265 [Terriglobales bacterium]|nr:hypothetical protein [Terriglobales bacterium]